MSVVESKVKNGGAGAGVTADWSGELPDRWLTVNILGHQAAEVQEGSNCQAFSFWNKSKTVRRPDFVLWSSLMPTEQCTEHSQDEKEVTTDKKETRVKFDTIR